MQQVNKERDPRVCEPMSDAERGLEVARQELRKTLSSESAQNLNVPSLERLSSHGIMVHENPQCLKRAVVEHKARVAAERKLATLRRLSGEVVKVRHSSFLRDAGRTSGGGSEPLGRLCSRSVQGKIPT